MDKKVWLSRRAIRLHVVILIVVPSFLALCFWQIDRALGGNSLSWAYVFEWPIFAAYAVYMWWRFVHEAARDGSPPADGRTVPGGPDAAAPPTAPDDGTPRAQGKPQEEDAALAAYNAYLVELAEHDRGAGR
jgi:hypothetical protein